MYIKVITTDTEFDEAKNEWQNFEKRVDDKNITSSYVWQRTWWRHFKGYEEKNFGQDKKLSILFLYNGKNLLRAIAPFCEVTREIKGLKYKAVEFLAQQWGANYLDIISDKLSREEYDFIFDWLKDNRKYDLIELMYIPEFTSIFNLKKNNTTVLSACPEIKIKNYKEVKYYIQKEYSKSLKKNLQTARNRMERENIDYREEVSDIISDADLKEIENVSRSKLKDNKHCIYDNPEKKKFLSDIYCNSELFSNVIKIMINDKLASYRINLLYHEFEYCCDASYDRSYPHYDLGAFSVNLSIRNSFEKGILTHCLGTGADPYKLKFSKQIIKIYTFLQGGNSLKGVSFYIIKKLRNRKIENDFLAELKINLYKN